MNRRAVIFVRIVLICAVVLCSCDARTRYRVFSPIFDGVPNPDQAAGTAAPGSRLNDSTARGELQKKQYTEHGPYAAKLCEGCHQRGTNKLIKPLESLCVHCHDITAEKKRVHGPIASGGCKVCHDPHSSPNRFLLVSESKEFCLYCHDKNEVFTREVHQGVSVECTTCHDAHSSDNDFLLK